jgi:hypothetical protein
MLAQVAVEKIRRNGYRTAVLSFEMNGVNP